MEKKTDIIAIRVPEALKTAYDKLKPEFKRKANEEARIAMAKIIHESRFDPKLYFGEDE
jgi:hypothetical protein